ncbi:MAG: T9SS type A sorting domain-containing protein, partial [Bacteroidota bacterium]
AGKLVKSTELNGLSTTINTTGLNNGVYYVTVSNGSATSTEKVVVKK